MVKFLLLISTIFFLGSCAIQGTISGGPIDKRPPALDTSKVTPSFSKTINFNQTEIHLPFKEFITLNKASENIIVVPNDFKIDPIAKDKVLTLKLKGQPKLNTTYAIYLNHAVKDIHEGNDTLLTYVFSTGDYIDSLTYDGKVIDIRNRLPIKGVCVSLYNDTITTFLQKAVNFTTTNEKGEFTLRYIKSGIYYIVAFKDQNNDFVPQSHELIGFKSNKVNLTTSFKDSVPIDLFPPRPKKALRRISHINNNEVLVTGNVPIDKGVITLFNQTISEKKIHRTDSISIFLNTNSLDTIRGVLSKDNYLDTFYCKINTKQNNKIPKLYLPLNIRPKNLMEITTNDFITNFNKDSIEVFANDSIKVPFELKAAGYKILLRPLSYFSAKSYKVTIKSSGLTFSNFKDSYKASHIIPVFDSTQYSIFNINTKTLPEGTILEILSGEKVIRQTTVSLKQSIWKIDDLEKGTYIFKAYFDFNNNGIWDSGDLQKQIQPEKIQVYNETFQARPNWELEINFDPIKWK